MSQNTPPASGSRSSISQNVDSNISNNDDNFEPLGECILKKRYPAVAQLHKFRSTNVRGQKDAKCKGCGEIWKEGRAIRLMRHSRECKSTNQASAKAFEEQFNQFQEKKSSLGSETIANKKQMIAEERLGIFIAIKSIPLSVVGNKSFRKFISHLNPSFKMPSRKRLSDAIISSLADSRRAKAMHILRSAPNYSLTLEFDGWTSCTGMGIMVILLTDLYGSSTVIDLVDTSDSINSAEKLAGVAIDSFERTEISATKLNAIITDEASNCKGARAIIKDNIAQACLLEYRCMAHVFNLIGAGVSKHSSIKPTLDKLIELINIIGRHKVLTAKIREMGGTKVVRAVPTRWYSTANSINSIIRLKPILDSLPRTENIAKSKWLPIVSDQAFWSNLKELVPYFNRLSNAIGIVEAKNSRLSDSFFELLKFGKFIFKDANQQSVFCRAAKESFLIHFSRCNYEMLICSYLLGPKRRLRGLTEAGIDLGIEYASTLLCDMGCRDQTVLAFFDEFKLYRRKLETQSFSITDLFKWWESSPLTVIKSVGMRFASAHASSANSERVLSALNRIITPSRNRINLSLVHDLMTIKVFEETLDAKSKNLSASADLELDELEPSNEIDELNEVEEDLSEQEEDLDDEHSMPLVEASILDTELLDQCGTLDEPLDESELAVMREYDLFFRLIDFDAKPVDSLRTPESPQEPSENSSSSERARRLLRIARSQ